MAKKHLLQNILINTERLSEICSRFEISQLSLFGSYSRAEASPSSDVDLLVEFDTPTSLIALISLQNELSSEFGFDVDLVTTDALSPYIRDQILEEAELIYAKG